MVPSPDAINSIGVGSASPDGPPSSGSIIAIIPEPVPTLSQSGLMVLGGLLLTVAFVTMQRRRLLE